MPSLLTKIFDIVIWGIFIVLMVWVFIRWMKKSQSEPLAFLGQWIATLAIIAAIIFIVRPMLFQIPMLAIPLAAAAGLCIYMIWASNIVNFFAKPFVDLYTGGSEMPDPEAHFSIAEAKRKRGAYQEAIAEIKNELSQFPNDFRGQMLMAEVQAENLHDLTAARSTIDNLLQQTEHSPNNLAFAINRLADWYIKYGNQTTRAQEVLEWIPRLYPGSEVAFHATQRITKLNPEMPSSNTPPRTITMVHHDEDFGLIDDFSGFKPKEESIETTLNNCIQRLNECPADNETREKLALLYARNYNRIDLGIDQLEQLIAQPGVPMRRVVHWLNLMADLQITCAKNQGEALKVLQRIVTLFPNSADAEKARQRIQYLNIEMKGQSKGSSIALKQCPPIYGIDAPNS